MKKHIVPIVVILALSYWTIRPLVGPGYFPMHDDTQVARVIVMGRALLNGQFPVRWVSGLGYGYGYPLYNFYGPLPYYIGGGLFAAGVDPVVATKSMMAIGMVIAGISMYALSAAVFGRISGILAATLYLFAPYHAVLLYVRGAVGELWAYALLPMALWGWIIGKNPKLKRTGMWLGGLGLAGVILSHTITGYVTVVFSMIGLAVYALICLLKRSFRISLSSVFFRELDFSLSLLFVGLGLSAFFWIPAVAEMGYTNVAGQIGKGADFHDHFVCLGQLWNSLWGFGGSVGGCVDGLPFKIGKLHIILGIIGLNVAYFRLRNTMRNRFMGLFGIIGAGSVFMMTSVSRPVWELIPGMRYVQYPWRFLTGITVAVSVMGATWLHWWTRRWIRVVALICICLIVVLVNGKVFVPQFIYDKPSVSFQSVEDISWRSSKVSDEYLPKTFQAPVVLDQISRAILYPDPIGGLRVETEIDTETYAKLHIEAQTSRNLTLNRIYFPGWEYWVNGKKQERRIVNGLPVLGVPQGDSVVELQFGNTPPRQIGAIISIGIFMWFVKTYGKKAFA